MTQKTQDTLKSAFNLGAPFCLALALLWGVYDILKPISVQTVSTMGTIAEAVLRAEASIASMKIELSHQGSDHERLNDGIRELANAVKKN